jgi:hypothetical protein
MHQKTGRGFVVNRLKAFVDLLHFIAKKSFLSTKQACLTAARNWDLFWFSNRDLRLLGLFRIALCGTLFLVNLDRQFDVKTFFTDQGIVPKDMALKIFPEFIRPLFIWSGWSDVAAPWMHGLLVIFLLLLTLGIGGRILNIFAWILQIAFLQRNYSVAFGADVIGSIFLLYLCGTQSCAEFSLLKRHKKVSSDILTNLFVRLIQVQLCIIYAFTGFEKLKGSSWWDGSALWTVFANSQMVIADLSWLRFFPWVIIGFTFLTILFEIYFPVLIWTPRMRYFLMLCGIFFHIGIGVIMGLWGFALVMLAPYFLFLFNYEDLQKRIKSWTGFYKVSK